MKRIIALLALLLLLFSACVPGGDPSSAVDSSNTAVSSGDNTSSEDNSSNIPTEPLPFVVEPNEFGNTQVSFLKTKDHIAQMSVYEDGIIYYVDNREGEGGKIYKMKSDGSDKSLVYADKDHPISNLCIENGQLYFVVYELIDALGDYYSGSVWKVNTDGTEPTIIRATHPDPHYAELYFTDCLYIKNGYSYIKQRAFKRAADLTEQDNHRSEFDYFNGDILAMHDGKIYFRTSYSSYSTEAVTYKKSFGIGNAVFPDAVITLCDIEGYNYSTVRLPGCFESKNSTAKQRKFIVKDDLFIYYNVMKRMLVWYDAVSKTNVRTLKFEDDTVLDYVYGNWVYYYKDDGIWRIDINGNGDQFVYKNDEIRNPQFTVLGDKLLVAGKNSYLYLMNYDGTGMVELN